MPGGTTDEEKAKLMLALKQGDIHDPRVLVAMEEVPRHAFVPETFRDRAYENIPLPLEFGQTISQPYVVAFMAQEMELKGREKVLEIGTGSGYNAAILSHLCRRVYTIERFPTLSREARERLEFLGYTNIITLIGDGTLGWPMQAPFDAIVSTAASEGVPNSLVDQLRIGSVLIVPIETDSVEQTLIRIVRTETGYTHEELLPVRFVPLLEGVVREP